MHKVLVFVSRILFRLLIFNLFLIFLPVAGFLYLDTYEKQLLASQEDSMVQQGRLVAMALADQTRLETGHLTEMLGRLKGRTLSRIRIVDAEGNLLADSSALKNALDGVSTDARRESETEQLPEHARKPSQETSEPGMEGWLSTQPETPAPGATPGGTGDSSADKNGFSEFVYQIIIFFLRLYRDILGMPKPDLGTAEYYTRDKPLLGPEIRAALEGRYGATTRYSVGGQVSIMMYSAIPVRNDREIIGAVLVSQSTYRILLDLYEVRVGTLQITLICAIFAVLMSIFLGNTIARPLKRLSHEAEAVLDKRGRLMRPIRPTHRLDEIGDLARSLSTLTQRLEQHIQFIESFAADLTHEFRNPLASIRSATEIAAGTRNKAEQDRFLRMVKQDVERMERLLSGAREITRIDVSIATEAVCDVDLVPLLSHIVDAARVRTPQAGFSFETREKSVILKGTGERYAQVFENLIDNAVSFSPSGGMVLVALSVFDGFAAVSIADQGPGIPPEHRERIFERFFSYRPQKSDARTHTGLGLSIVKVIVQGYEGGISVQDNQPVGALFTVRFPLPSKT